jgi:hypothetical protein
VEGRSPAEGPRDDEILSFQGTRRETGSRNTSKAREAEKERERERERERDRERERKRKRERERERERMCVTLE